MYSLLSSHNSRIKGTQDASNYSKTAASLARSPAEEIYTSKGSERERGTERERKDDRSQENKGWKTPSAQGILGIGMTNIRCERRV